MKKFSVSKFSASVVIFLTTIISMLFISSACFFIVYQPEMPQKPQ